MGLNYLVMDMEKLEFPPEVFDVVLDKATVDSILCSGDEVLPSEESQQGAR